MSEQMKSYISKLHKRAVLSAVATLFAVDSITLGIACLFIPSMAAILFFLIAAIAVFYVVYTGRLSNREAKENNFKPIIFTASKNMPFDRIVDILENLTYEDEYSAISDTLRFYKFRKIFKLRVILYRTEQFDKKEFDAAKKRMNRKANNELYLSHFGDGRDARKMRFNIVYTDTMNEELYQVISSNACHNLQRYEGVVNIAVAGNLIYIPPIYGNCDLLTVGRYKKVIKFVERILLK